jgi:hypothetical protein
MQNCVPVSVDEVIAAAEEAHKDFSDSKAWTLHVIKARTAERGAKWYRCRFGEGVVRQVQLTAHLHGNRRLVEDGGTIETAVSAIRSDPTYNVVAPECDMRITAIRTRVKQGEVLSPIFLYEEGGRIHHIDGLHRMVGWCLEDLGGTLEGYLGR